jgi:MFS family permease
LSIGSIIGCVILPLIAEKFGRRLTLGFYFTGMLALISATFAWAYYLPTPDALPIFMTLLLFLGFFGANFALFSLWLPELFGTEVRATAFAFCTSVGRFVGAGVNFALGAAVHSMGTLGTPVAATAIAFGIALLIIPFSSETKGQILPS